jgi:inositol-phosphate transport system ATP-binding protein
MLRSIQPARSDVALNDEVEWRLRSETLLLFDAQGERL